MSAAASAGAANAAALAQTAIVVSIRFTADQPFGHASRLGDHVREDAKVGEHDQGDHPDRLDPAGDIMAPEQVAYDYDEQPEP
jgi:hypothetical protein